MSTPLSSCFDLVPPRRPSLDDFNGVLKQDDEAFPPNVQTMPNAAEWNFKDWLLLSIGRVMPVAVFSVTGGTTPVLANFPCASSLVTGATFTTTRTAAGNVIISWPANTFPPANAKPVAALNDGPGMIWAVMEGNGVRVKTYNAAGTLADLSFTVEVR